MNFEINQSNPWSFYNPVNIIFGPGTLNKLQGYVEEDRALLVTTPGFTKRGVVDRVKQMLEGKEIRVLDGVKPNPDLADLEEQAGELKNTGVEVIIALGGGSVMDTAKAYSFILGAGNEFSLRKHFEEKELLPACSTVPILAVPTTAGTGSEATPFATIWDLKKEKKYSLAASNLFSQYALLDPELTLDMPVETTVSSGLDALSHALEAVWNHHANPVTLLYSARSLSLVMDNLEAVYHEPGNLQRRARMMEASLLGGMAISATRTALAHSMSYPVTARFGMPHGLACSFTLPGILEYNLEEDDGRIRDFADILGYASVEYLKEDLLRLFDSLGIEKALKKYVPSMEEIINLAPEMITPGRSENNLRLAGVEDIENLLVELKGRVLNF